MDFTGMAKQMMDFQKGMFGMDNKMFDFQKSPFNFGNLSGFAEKMADFQKTTMGNLNTSGAAKQMIDFQKTMVDNTFKAMIKFQEQSETMTNAVLEKNTMLPEQSKNTIQYCMKTYKNAIESMKNNVDGAYEKMGKAFVSPE